MGRGDGPSAIRRAAIRVRLAVLETHRPDSCVATTGALCDYLGGLGIPARPLAVGAMLINDIFYDRVRVLGRFPENARERDECFRAGGWTVGIGYGGTDAAGDPGIGAHLVAIAELGGECWLVDASLDQADRPDRGIRAGVVIRPADRDFLAGIGRVEARLIAGRVLYEARPGERGYEAAPDWSEERRAATVARVRARDARRAS